MPRPLTTKERAYLGRLAVRNLTEQPEDPTEGREKPMPAAERMRRKRIREKAQKAIRDLLLADRAGVIEVREMLRDNELGFDFMLADRFGQDGEIVVETKEEREELFYRLLGEPPEDVPME